MAEEEGHSKWFHADPIEPALVPVKEYIRGMVERRIQLADRMDEITGGVELSKLAILVTMAKLPTDWRACMESDTPTSSSTH